MDQGKPMKNEDGSWNLNALYRNSNDPYDLEYVRYENPRTGATQVFLLHSDKQTHQVKKYREL